MGSFHSPPNVFLCSNVRTIIGFHVVWCAIAHVKMNNFPGRTAGIGFLYKLEVSRVATQIDRRPTAVHVTVILPKVHRLTIDCSICPFGLRLAAILPVSFVVVAAVWTVALPAGARHVKMVLFHGELRTQELATNGARPRFTGLPHHTSINTTIEVVDAIDTITDNGVVVKLPTALHRPIRRVTISALFQHRAIARAGHG
jgi:hypothetical protein